MAVVGKSIGSSGRDYSTMTLWEADLDDAGIYDAGDIALGQCYNDSEFDEDVTFNGGGTLGLASATLTAPAGQRHDGTAGTGARIVASTGRQIIKGSGDIPRHVEWLELDLNGNGVGEPLEITGIANNSIVGSFSRMIVHDNPGASNVATGYQGVALTIPDEYLHNSIFYDCDYPFNVTVEVIDLNAQSHAYNVTVHGCSSAGASADFAGIRAGKDVRNCAVTGVSISGSGTASDFAGAPSGTESHNASEDTTAAGTGSLTEITPADQYVSTVDGSEDLHIKSGSGLIDAGTDLGTTPSGVEIDIDGRNRDTEGDTWDIGAHEFVGVVGFVPPRTTPLLGLRVELRNTDGDLLEILGRDIIEAEWSFAAQGGFENAVISLARDFNAYGDIGLDYDVRIFIDDNTGAFTARWSGFVRALKPIFDDLESVRLSCAGYSRQLDYIAVPSENYPSQDVGAIVRDILDTYVVPGTQIIRSDPLGLVEDVGVVTSATGLSFDTSARQAIESLAAIGGNAEWGVRSDFLAAPFTEQFYFQARDTTVNQIHLIGDRVKYYDEETSTDEIVRRVFIRGSGSFTATATSSLGNPSGFQKERVMLLPFISDAADATLWATAFFSRFETAQPKGRLELGAVESQIEDFRPLGRLRVMGGTIQQWYGTGSGFGSDGFGEGPFAVDGSTPFSAERVGPANWFRDFRINRVTYRFGSAGLDATVELGETRTALEDYFGAIEFKLNELRQVAV